MTRLTTQLVVFAVLGLASAPSLASAQAEGATAWAYCFSGQPAHCVAAGQHYLDGTGGVPRTPSWAALAWNQGCDAGDMPSCGRLGTLHEAGMIEAGIARDPRRALQLYERACRASDAFGCHRAAGLLWLGRGVARNPRRAAQLEDRACDRGNADACVALASAAAVGSGIPPDVARQRQLLARACQLGHAGACLGQIAADVACLVQGQ